MAALGVAYVRFARANPGLFLLMFRSERLDFTRPALCHAADAALGRLTGSMGDGADAAGNAASPLPEVLSIGQAAGIVAAWSMVHGLAMLLIDGRLKPIVERLPAGTGEADLLAALARRGD